MILRYSSRIRIGRESQPGTHSHARWATGSYLARLGLLLVSLLGSSLVSHAWAESPAADDHFETSIRPLLAERCFSCHGPKKQWSSLRLDSRDGMLKGGDNGAAIVVGKPEESELLKRVQEQDEDLRDMELTAALIVAGKLATKHGVSGDSQSLIAFLGEFGVTPGDIGALANALAAA